MTWGWKSVTGCIGFGIGAVIKAVWPENPISGPMMELSATLAGIGIAHKAVKIQRAVGPGTTPPAVGGDPVKDSPYSVPPGNVHYTSKSEPQKFSKAEAERRARAAVSGGTASGRPWGGPEGSGSGAGE